MEAVDQAVDDLTGDVIRIFRRDFQGRHRLLALPFHFLRRERGTPDDVGQELESKRQPVFHDDRVGVRQIRARAGAENAPLEVDRVGNLLRGARARPLIEELRGQHRETELALRVHRRAGTHDHPHADRRLLVVADDDHLQAVRQRVDLVGREVDRARGERPRRPFARPRARLRHESADEGDQQAREHEGMRLHCALPFGITCRTTRCAATKYVRATRCTSAAVIFWKMSNSPSAVVMSE